MSQDEKMSILIPLLPPLLPPFASIFVTYVKPMSCSYQVDKVVPDYTTFFDFERQVERGGSLDVLAQVYL